MSQSSRYVAGSLILMVVLSTATRAVADSALVTEQVTINAASQSSAMTGATGATDQLSVTGGDLGLGNVGNGLAQARAGSPTGLDPRALLGASATVYSGGADGPATVHALADAQWHDTMYLDGSPPAGFMVRFDFKLHLSGIVGVVSEDDPNSYYVAGAALLAGAQTASGADIQRSAVGALSSDPSRDINRGDWDDFLSTMHMDVSLAPGDATAGIALSFELQAFATVLDGSATLDAFRTAGIPSILIGTPDQGFVTPESMGYHIRFESGLASPNAAAVPEPASLLMLGMGVVGALGYAGRRGVRPGTCLE